MKRYTEEKERLEKKKEEIRGHLAQLRKEKRELKETLLKCTGNGVPRRGTWALSGGARAESRSAHLVRSPVSLWHRWMLPGAVLHQDVLEKLIQGGTLKLNLCV